jgi:hypothetical protein
LITPGLGFLPDGLTLNSSTGVISGTPTAASQFNFEVQVNDTGNPPRNTHRPLSITVDPALAITTAALQGGNVSSPYLQNVIAFGGTAPFTWKVVSGALPAGLSLGSSTGAIAGTPTTPGRSTFTIQVTDSLSATASRDLLIDIGTDIGSPVPIISTSAFPTGTAGISYVPQSVIVSGGVPPYAFSVVEGAGLLPPGLTLSATGILAGSPSQAGSFGFTVRVTDSSIPPQSVTKALSITINPALTITTTSLPGVDVGIPYSVTLAASGGSQPFTWTVTGALPGGLTLNSTTGVLSGTPTSPGTANFRVHLADLVGLTTFKDLSIVVSFPQLDTSIPANSKAVQQTPLAFSLKSPYPVDLSGQITLTFTSSALIPSDDPMLQFSTGSRTADFTIPANSLNAVFPTPVMLLTGTVAGTVRMSASFANGPSDLLVGTTVIPLDAPQMTAVDATLTGNTIVVRVTGYSVNRSVSNVIFGFDVQTGSGTQRINAPRSVDADFSTWYQNPQSSAFGSAYVFAQSFTVQGDASGIRTVTVTLSNTLGSTTSATATLVRK